MTLSRITVLASHYRLTATVPGRTLATAVRTAWDSWHVPLWAAAGSRDEAARVVYAVAAKRLAGVAG